jgi:hypothetical protein
VQQGLAGAAAESAAQAAASAGAAKAAEELGADAHALELHLLDSVPALLSAIASESEATRAPVAASQAEIEAAVDRVRVGLEAKLDGMQIALARANGGPSKSSKDCLEPELLALLKDHSVSQHAGFFYRCQVLSVHALASVLEEDMHELGLSPRQALRLAAAARAAAGADLKCPLRSGHGGDDVGTATGDVLPPLPPRRLKPVLDPSSPLLKEVLENPAKHFTLKQSMGVVLDLITAGEEQALKLSGLSTVMVLGATGTNTIKCTSIIISTHTIDA